MLKPTNKEDNSFEPVVAEDESHNEESNSEENGNTGDDVDEMLDFLGDGRVTGVDVGGEGGDAAHDGVVTASDNDTTSGTLDAVGWEEGNVLGLQNLGLWVFGIAGLKIDYRFFINENPLSDYF